MLIKAKDLNGYSLNSLDGEIGNVKEFYFDDKFWTIRYLVADTGHWLIDRQVLISPYALININTDEQNIAVNLTKKQIEDSPPLSSQTPVSRQFEEAYYGYYEWPAFWGGPKMWGAYPYIVRDRERLRQRAKNEKGWDHHLRSSKDMGGHHIQANDGEIGHVTDFIIDDATWTIRYMEIDTSNWWLGKTVLIATKWIKHVSWQKKEVLINLTREEIRESPEYSEEFLINRDYETKLHKHYNRQGYWVD